MLFSENRIKKKSDFKNILNNGDTIYSDIVVIKFLNNGLKQTRFGLIVSRKVSRSAVKRNKIKRILREQLRINLSNFREGLDLIVIAKKAIIYKKSDEVWKTLEKIFLEKEILLKDK